MLDGYHRVFRAVAAKVTAARPVYIPDFKTITGEAVYDAPITKQAVKPRSPVLKPIASGDYKDLNNIAGGGPLIQQDNFPTTGWLGGDLTDGMGY